MHGSMECEAVSMRGRPPTTPVPVSNDRVVFRHIVRRGGVESYDDFRLHALRGLGIDVVAVAARLAGVRPHRLAGLAREFVDLLRREHAALREDLLLLR